MLTGKSKVCKTVGEEEELLGLSNAVFILENYDSFLEY